MKVKARHWTMDSDPGYSPSSGACRVYLIPADEVVMYAASEKALYDFANEFEFVSPSEFEDTEPLEWRRGVCNYRGVEGVLCVPDGMVAVQRSYEAICTNDKTYYYAEILNEESLKELYRQRAEHYAKLADEIS